MGARIQIGRLEFRQFAAEDTRALYCIRNHPSVRGYLPDPSLIPYAAHRAWVQKELLEGRNLCLFLVREAGQPIGFALLKRCSPDTLEIGVMIREADRHPLVPVYAGALMLYWAFCRLGATWVVSYPVHPRALALNQYFGPEEVASDRPGKIKLRLHRDVGLADPNYRRVFGRIQGRMVVEETA